MEIIHIPGYSEFEKLKIAQAFLIPKQIEENGLGWAKISFQEAAILKTIQNYTMESGVRNLERQIATVLRKIARQAVKKGLPEETVDSQPEEAEETEETATGKKTKRFSITVTPRRISEFLGNESYQEKMLDPTEKPGLVYGLAWTELGGRLLPVEVALLEGKGELILTGSLGEVMKESAQTALSFLRSHADDLEIQPDFSADRDIHIHVPEGSIPKDGPSAGITIGAALLSALRGKAVQKGFAMTGEITLTGRLLPIGGIKEKVLAAHRNRMTDVLMPEMNRKDIEELPREVRTTMTFHFAETILDALLILFPEKTKTR
jgi:ATP-dependent Lon protease